MDLREANNVPGLFRVKDHWYYAAKYAFVRKLIGNTRHKLLLDVFAAGECCALKYKRIVEREEVGLVDLDLLGGLAVVVVEGEGVVGVTFAGGGDEVADGGRDSHDGGVAVIPFQRVFDEKRVFSRARVCRFLMGKVVL